MALPQLLLLMVSMLPFAAAALTSLIVSRRVHRDRILLFGTLSAGAAAMGVVIIFGMGLRLLDLLSTPRPGAGGPWAFGAISLKAIIYFSGAYGFWGAIVGLAIAGVILLARKIGNESG